MSVLKGETWYNYEYFLLGLGIGLGGSAFSEEGMLSVPSGTDLTKLGGFFYGVSGFTAFGVQSSLSLAESKGSLAVSQSDFHGIGFGAGVSIQGGFSRFIGTTGANIIRTSPTANYPNPSIACFLKGTLVYTPSGYIKIEELIENDKTYSLDIIKNKLIENKIIKTYRKKLSGYYILECLNELIYVTSEHPFYVKNKGWITAKDLHMGDLLIANNKIVAINEIIYKDEIAYVYNITVEAPNNYLVTKLGILVHNK